MKACLFFILLILSEFIAAQKGATPYNSLENKVKHSDIIMEGRVVAKSSISGFNGGMPFTSNYIIPLKWFKGNFIDTIEMLTIEASHAFKVRVNTDYLFFFKKADSTFLGSGRTTYFPISVDTGVIIIDPQGPAAEEYTGKQYADLENELYKPIAKIVGNDYKMLLRDHKEERAAKKEIDDSLYRHKVEQANDRHCLLFKFSTQITKPDTSTIGFNIDIQSARRYGSPGEQFVSCTVFIRYDSAFLGSKLVADGYFKASLLPELKTKGYTLSITDYQAGLIKISVTQSSTDSVNLVSLKKDLLRLLHCSISAKNKHVDFNKIYLAFDDALMEHGSTYFDSSNKSTKAFESISVTGLKFLTVN